MRGLLAGLLLTLLTGPLKAELRVEPPVWRSTESFQRIREFFTGEELADGVTVLRTDAGSRAGLYFRLASAASASEVRVEVLAGEVLTPREYTFSLEGEAPWLLGLTGADWPRETLLPTAWRVVALDAEGEELAEAVSFAWELP